MSKDFFSLRPKEILAVSLLSLAATVIFLLTKEPSLRGVADIGWDFGPLADSLSRHRGYQAQVYAAGVKYMAFSHRMPVIPFFHAAFAGLGLGLSFSFFIRSLFLGLLALPAVRVMWAMCGKKLASIFLILVLSCPLVIRQFVVLQTEEAWLVVLVPSAFVALSALSRPNLFDEQGRRGLIAYVAFLAALIYMIKSSMVYVSLLFLVFTLARAHRFYRNKARLAALVLAPLALSLLAWNVHVLSTGGPFTLGTSWDGWNIRKGNNQYFEQYYPRTTLNELESPESPGFVSVLSPSIKKEWAIDSDMRTQAKQWIQTHREQFVANTLLKVRSALFDPRPIPLQGSGGMASKALTTAIWLVVKVVAWTLVLSPVAAYVLFGSTRYSPGFLVDQQLLFCSFLALYLAPYIFGFYYSRHGVPLIPVVAAMAAIRIADYISWARQRRRSKVFL